MDVVLTNQTKVDVNCAYKNNALLAIAEKEGFVNVPMQDFKEGIAVKLQPAKSYKFRVAAVNSMGVGPWSEVTAYRTLIPGLPGAPSTVQVNKSEDGAIVSWDAPSDPAGSIKDFAVFLAVNINNGLNKNLSFQRVYVGPERNCLVTKSQLQNAMIDTSGSGPCVIFRIAARNENGCGPATQVRWLQGA